MRWPGIEGIYGPTLRTTTVFGAGGEKRLEDLHTRVIEHVRAFLPFLVASLTVPRISE
jgi:26S proteasome regulatory subunit N5